MRYGNLLLKGTQSVEIFPASRSILAASPTYLAKRIPPASPAELNSFDLIACRSRTTGLITTWPLVSASGKHRVEPRAWMIASDMMAQLDLTSRDLGISCTPRQCIAPYLKDGSLVQVLSEWYVPLAPMHLYYPARSARNPALRAFIDHHLAFMNSPELMPDRQVFAKGDLRRFR